MPATCKIPKDSKAIYVNLRVTSGTPVAQQKKIGTQMNADFQDAVKSNPV